MKCCYRVVINPFFALRKRMSEGNLSKRARQLLHCHKNNIMTTRIMCCKLVVSSFRDRLVSLSAIVPVLREQRPPKETGRWWFSQFFFLFLARCSRFSFLSTVFYLTTNIASHQVLWYLFSKQRSYLSCTVY